MRMQRYDFIVIGAGHNGLVTAAYLAKAGRRVLVLERRSIVGGSCVTEELAPALTADAVWAGGQLRPDIVRDLRLVPRPPADSRLFTSVWGPGRDDRLVIDPDPRVAAHSIRRFSEKDAVEWPAFVGFMNRAAAFLDEAYATIMPRLPRGMNLREGLGLAELGLDLRLLGGKDMLRFIRMLPMTAVELLEEWFESEELKSALASVAVHASTLGPMSAGTGFTLLHNWLNRGGLAQANAGRAGEVTQGLAQVVAQHGGEIRLEAEVERILVDGYACRGVRLRNAEEIEAGAVISALDPKRTFLSLVEPVNLPPDFVWQVQSIKMRGSVSKLHLLTNGQHDIPAGTVVLSPSIRYLERAYDAAKYGRSSAEPYLELTSRGEVVSIHIQYTPYALQGSGWDKERGNLENLALDALAPRFPRLKASIVVQTLLTPADLEAIYGLTEGDLNHGQLMLDQFLFMRPVPGWSHHRTPIDNLYLCGSGSHGGGGISGAAGRNAAKMLLASAPLASGRAQPEKG